MKRIFAAIKIHPSESLKQTFMDLRNTLNHERIVWVDLNNIHITLKFFGETDDSRIPGIREAMEKAALTSRQFDLNIRRTGIFGSHYNPKVIWFGIDPEPGLELLWTNLTHELKQEGWEPDRQNFVPHLTIGRIKGLQDKDLFQHMIDKYLEVRLLTETIDRLILYESFLSRQGPRYVELVSFSLH